MELMLGRFGDRRLEKGGSFFWTVFCRSVREGFECASLAATGPERSA